MYKSDIVLGEKYLDGQTGIEGIATSVTFFQHACERVALELLVNGELQEYVFDSPRLTRVETGEVVAADKPGGPQRTMSHTRPGPLSRR